MVTMRCDGCGRISDPRSKLETLGWVGWNNLDFCGSCVVDLHGFLKRSLEPKPVTIERTKERGVAVPKTFCMNGHILGTSDACEDCVKSRPVGVAFGNPLENLAARYCHTAHTSHAAGTVPGCKGEGCKKLHRFNEPSLEKGGSGHVG